MGNYNASSVQDSVSSGEITDKNVGQEIQNFSEAEITGIECSQLLRV